VAIDGTGATALVGAIMYNNLAGAAYVVTTC
jgi:hypothetical protein